MEDKAIKIVGLGAEAMEKYVDFKYYESVAKEVFAAGLEVEGGLNG